MFKRVNRKAASILIACMLAAGASAVQAESDDGNSAISLDTLYSLPRLAGTSPESFIWAGDSKHLAFLWNDRGLAFRDIWICRAENCQPRALTAHGGQVPETSLHGGINEAVWKKSPDSGLIYVLNGQLHSVDISGSQQTFEDSKESVSQISLSPNGETLAFVNGGPVDQRAFEFRPGGGLWVRNASPDGAPAREIVSTQNDIQYVESYVWSADGSTIVFVLADQSAVAERHIRYQSQGMEKVRSVRRAFPGEETTKRHIGVVNLASGDINWLPRNDELRPIWGYSISGDSKRVLVSESDFLIKEHVIDVYDLSTGARETFYKNVDASNVIPGWKAVWAPNDDGLIILTDLDGYYQLYHQRKAGGKPTRITRGEWEIAEFSIDAEGKQIYFVSNETHSSQRQIYRVALGGGKPERLSQRVGTHLPVFAPDHSIAAVRFSSDSEPAELYLNELEVNASERRITHSPSADFSNYQWAQVSYPSFKSHIDGTPLVGRLLLPPDFDASRRYPLIVGTVYPNTVRNTWGGGSAIPIWGLDQHLVSLGYVVFSVDVRGSWGHGRKFSQGLLGDYGGIDTDDIESGVRHILAQGYIDPDRVGIWGWSYGGLMTLMSLAKKSDLYTVGVADAPATNVWHAFPEQMWVMGERKGPDYPARYERLSALYQSDRIVDPVMILHGTADAVVMYADSVAFIEKMIAREALYEFVPIPGTTHVWAEGSLERQRFGYKKIVEFLNRHLQP